MLEIMDEAGLLAWLADAGRSPAVLLDLDLTRHETALAKASLAGAVLVGGAMTPATAAQAAAQGATLLGRRADVPFDMYRADVYGVADIYQGFDPATPGSWERSFDHRAYEWFMDPVKKVPKPIGLGIAAEQPVHLLRRLDVAVGVALAAVAERVDSDAVPDGWSRPSAGAASSS